MVTVEHVEKLFTRSFKKDKSINSKVFKPLSLISFDDANNQSLVPFSAKFYDFDEIAKLLYNGDTPKTPDMIFFSSGKIYFVEFKNGRIFDRKVRCNKRGPNDECKYVKWDLKLKIIEGSFLVFKAVFDKYDKDIPIRKTEPGNGEKAGIIKDILDLERNYILVYNSRKNYKSKNECEQAFGNRLNNFQESFKQYKKTLFNDFKAMTEDGFINWLKMKNLLSDSDKFSEA